MSKRVSIVLPEEMPPAPSGSRKAPRPAVVKSSIKSGSIPRSDQVPPVFVVVSPQSSRTSMTSSQRTITSNSDSSLNLLGQERSSSTEAAATPEHSALVLTDSPPSQQSVNLESASTSIKQFLRSTVDLVRAGESFTSVKRLFHKFIKSGGGALPNPKPSLSSAASSQAVKRENPYLSKSNDTLLSDTSAQPTVPSSSQWTSPTIRSKNTFNAAKYDITSLLSDITPLTGYTPTEEPGYRTDSSGRPPKTQRSDLASVGGAGQLSGSKQSSKHSTLELRSDRKLEVESSVLARRSISKNRSSSRSPRQKLRSSTAGSPRRTPRMSPRKDLALPAEHVFALVSASVPNSEGERPRNSRRRSSQGSSGPSAKVTTRKSGSSVSGSRRNSGMLAKSGGDQTPRSIQSRTSSRRGSLRSTRTRTRSRSRSRSQSRSRSGSRASASGGPLQVSENLALKAEHAFALVSPEEAETSQPAEGTGGEVEDASSACVTYQEQCKCHHCLDMRRAVKRAKFFQSPEGQKQLEAKLLAKNFFMDLCALSEVRSRVHDDLHGIRRRPSPRVSFPVSICGATRLDGGSLALQWFTHDLDSVDHFDFFVDGVPNRSVYNLRGSSTVLVDVDAAKSHKLLMRAVPARGASGRDSSVDRLMSEVAAGHMRHVRQGQLFAKCLQHLDARPQPLTVVDFWTDSEFLYLPTCEVSPSTQAR
ncbi:LOW QUALITY PROTEIN: nucleolar and coiled-body phosphoprotein 1 [Drosophila ficusphila]|uniref:LOW QUALITY PROTEIN: nucleolar and coiled-body phosphoprotein 1 n=1 Tax=Drosophila ficusphila TaxID=30025 RepID=UPI001C89E526|nr:LOW QUALITY PROTEIN: nucleolar and coiled-body phosphoprotein 1 [Drosophila ficusphila]